MRKTKYPQFICSACRKAITANENGTFRSHGTRYRRCTGSGTRALKAADHD